MTSGSVTRFLALASTSALLSMVTAVPAHAATAPKTVVLVHGAWADGSSWDKVIPLLLAKGLKVVAVQIPLTSLADDVAATKRVLDDQTGPVILVGHSWGGMVITQAGDDAKVAALVYVAAFAPDEGQAAGDLGKDLPPPPGLKSVHPNTTSLPTSHVAMLSRPKDVTAVILRAAAVPSGQSGSAVQGRTPPTQRP